MATAINSTTSAGAGATTTTAADMAVNDTGAASAETDASGAGGGVGGTGGDFQQPNVTKAETEEEHEGPLIVGMDEPDDGRNGTEAGGGHVGGAVAGGGNGSAFLELGHGNGAAGSSGGRVEAAFLDSAVVAPGTLLEDSWLSGRCWLVPALSG